MAKAENFDPTDITPGPASPYHAKLVKVAKLKAGVWRELQNFESRDGAKTALFRLRKRYDEFVPAGQWQFATHRNPDGSQLMVRYMGPAKKPMIGWWRFGKLVDEVPLEESEAKSQGARDQWTEKWTGASKGSGTLTKAQKKAALKRARG